MGQRHQVYVISKSGDEILLDAFHAQWSYGSLPIKAVDSVIDFVEKVKDATLISYWTRTKLFESLLSLNRSSMTFNNHFSINEEVTAKNKLNPLMGDNNDGITILDVRNTKKPKVMFMFLFDVEGAGGFVTLTATEYFNRYYSDNSEMQEANKELLKKIDAYYFDNLKGLQKYFHKKFLAEFNKANKKI